MDNPELSKEYIMKLKNTLELRTFIAESVQEVIDSMDYPYFDIHHADDLIDEINEFLESATTREESRTPKQEEAVSIQQINTMNFKDRDLFDV